MSSQFPAHAQAPGGVIGGQPASRLDPLAYLLMRTVFGLVMMTHGLPKLLGTSHGSMADPMAGATRLIAEVLHLPGAPVLAWLVAVLETFGGAMLIAGAFTRPLAALMTLQMIAICYIHRQHFAWIDRGMEYPLVLLSVALLIAARGGGAWSLDGALAARRRSRAGQGAMRARPPWRD
ncbi:DoxX family protein [Cupriavidus gilardii]|uniref:DoxX family protein n=1 Tax=Cupriavidus gilardii TaxID=82541 RepID=UPI001580D7D4|nr:DoxX family protein [Cupriavidus gilardii]MCT9071439.1 DoxX family protein [Cupriavidus gilardii]QKS61524.1 DoxX family protein [Cupriavidus gilardii]